MENKKNLIINKINQSLPGIKQSSLHTKSVSKVIPGEDLFVLSRDLPNKMPVSRTALSRTVLENNNSCSKSNLFEDWPPPTKMVAIKDIPEESYFITDSDQTKLAVAEINLHVNLDMFPP